MNDALDTRYKQKHAGGHPAIPWLIEHAADVINRTSIGTYGRTPYRKWRGRNFNNKVAEFGDNVWYLNIGSVGKHNFKPRWEDGIYLGCMDGTGETIIGTEDGAIKAKDFRRKTINA